MSEAQFSDKPTEAADSLTSYHGHVSQWTTGPTLPDTPLEDETSLSDGDTDEPEHIIRTDPKVRRYSASEVSELNGSGVDIDFHDSFNHLDRSLFYGRGHTSDVPYTKSSLLAPSVLDVQADEEPAHPDTLYVPPPLAKALQEAPSRILRPSPRVRFRSRVRITSGLHRHRRATIPGETASAASSASASPSSSISAPLRSQSDDESTQWGPLGRRVSYFAWQKRMHRPPASLQQQQNHRPHDTHLRRSITTEDLDVSVDEHTPLIIASSRYIQRRHSREDLYDDDEQNRRIDAVFGTWPGRLLNHRWWWWQLEPVVCCHCAEESDTDTEE